MLHTLQRFASPTSTLDKCCNICKQLRMKQRKTALASYRKTQGLTLQHLADRLKVNKSTVLRWERRTVPPERVPQVEKLTGIPRKLLNDLF